MEPTSMSLTMKVLRLVGNGFGPRKPTMTYAETAIDIDRIAVVGQGRKTTQIA